MFMYFANNFKAKMAHFIKWLKGHFPNRGFVDFTRFVGDAVLDSSIGLRLTYEGPSQSIVLFKYIKHGVRLVKIMVHRFHFFLTMIQQGVRLPLVVVTTGRVPEQCHTVHGNEVCLSQWLSQCLSQCLSQ